MQLRFSILLYLTITEMRGDIGTRMIQHSGFTPEMWGCELRLGILGWSLGCWDGEKYLATNHHGHKIFTPFVFSYLYFGLLSFPSIVTNEVK